MAESATSNQRAPAFRVDTIRSADGPSVGLGLVATTSVPQGLRFHNECPIVSQQHAVNKGMVMSCSRCHRSVGSVSEQLTYFYVPHPESVEYIKQLEVDVSQLPTVKSCRTPLFSKTPPVVCQNGCGQFYCSESCRDEDFASNHSHLCVGSLDDKHPLVLLKEYCLDVGCENMLLAAQLICMYVMKAEKEANESDIKGDKVNHAVTLFRQHMEADILSLNSKQSNRATQSSSTDSSSGASSSNAGKVAADNATKTTDEETVEEEEIDWTAFVAKATEYLRSGLKDQSPVYSRVVDSALVQQLLDIFSICNTDIQIRNPVNSYFRHLLLSNEVPYAVVQGYLIEKEVVMCKMFGPHALYEDEINYYDEDMDMFEDAEAAAAAAADSEQQGDQNVSASGESQQQGDSSQMEKDGEKTKPSSDDAVETPSGVKDETSNKSSEENATGLSDTHPVAKKMEDGTSGNNDKSSKLGTPDAGKSEGQDIKKNFPNESQGEIQPLVDSSQAADGSNQADTDSAPMETDGEGLDAATKPKKPRTEAEKKRLRLSTCALKTLMPMTTVEMPRGVASVRSYAFPEIHGFGLYPSIARMNHSCLPNVALEFDDSAYNRVTFVSLRTITAGDELCISYLRDVESISYQDRQDALKLFGFTCRCSRCTQESSSESTERRN